MWLLLIKCSLYDLCNIIYISSMSILLKPKTYFMYHQL